RDPYHTSLAEENFEYLFQLGPSC
ncbi:unnamed protein product, partial [Allacma fusca]